MKNEEIKKNIEEIVLKKIESGDIKMVPKSYFVFRATILTLFTVIVFILSVTLVSFIVFSLSARGDLFLLGFGKKGIIKFILMFPWFLLSVDAILILILDYLVRRFSFGYHSPIIYLFLGTLVFVTSFSFVLTFTSFHSKVSGFVRRNHVPFAGSMYDEINKSRRDKGIFRGVVTSMGDNYIVIRRSDFDGDADDVEIKIMAPDGLDPKSFIHTGEEVYVAGDIASGTVVLPYGLHKLSSPPIR